MVIRQDNEKKKQKENKKINK